MCLIAIPSLKGEKIMIWSDVMHFGVHMHIKFWVIHLLSNDNSFFLFQRFHVSLVTYLTHMTYERFKEKRWVIVE
jgi:hypothetical protein